MALNNDLNNELSNAIKNYDFPLVSFDFLNSKQISHKNIEDLEPSIRNNLVSGIPGRVKDGFSNTLYWGFHYFCDPCCVHY